LFVPSPPHAPTLDLRSGMVGAYRTVSAEMEKVLMRWQAFIVALFLPLLVGLTVRQACGGQQQPNLGVAGVVVDAQGVLQRMLYQDPGGTLTRQRMAAARASLAPDLQRFSPLRKVCLNRLEEAIRHNQGMVTDEMRYLAGLLRVRYVFFYPETGDIVLAGPAEGWMTNLAGRVVGLTTGQPVVQLQDLVVALRAFPPGAEPTPVVGCSIDPTQEGLAALQRFLRAFGPHARRDQTLQFAVGVRSSLGMQEVTVNGVPADTHFAQVMVEADYRMKLIGIGLETPPVRLVSFVERVSPSQVSRNALFRWFFVPDYQCVRRSEDGLAMELVGDGVKLVGEDELVSATGQRQAAQRSNRASQAFVQSFTEKYPELAKRSPVYAELRNLIDLVIVAAYIQQEDLYGKANWKMELFGSEEALPVRTYNAPRKAESAVNALWKGSTLMTPIGGGVEIRAAMALQPENILPDQQGKVSQLREQTRLELAEGQWWWD